VEVTLVCLIQRVHPPAVPVSLSFLLLLLLLQDLPKLPSIQCCMKWQLTPHAFLLLHCLQAMKQHLEQAAAGKRQLTVVGALQPRQACCVALETRAACRPAAMVSGA
jgi:hypothetical protein